MENNGKILLGHSDLEKGAYLGAIASIASADRSASPEEIEYLSDLCDAAELSERQKAAVLHAASEESGEDLMKCLDVLKKSDLKYSLVADLMAFAKTSGDYSTEEQQNIEKISKYLGVDEHQASLLDEFADKAANTDATPEEMSKPDFLSSLGLKDKLQSAGINGHSLLKGLLGIAGPMILSSMITRGLSGGRSGGGFLGGRNSMTGGGGLGSLIGMLSGGRSMNSTGGLFGRILGRGF
jgi:uncharacterized tellurite resistance protein B-like protein